MQICCMSLVIAAESVDHPEADSATMREWTADAIRHARGPSAVYQQLGFTSISINE
jgi:hypothetical protein